MPVPRRRLVAAIAALVTLAACQAPAPLRAPAAASPRPTGAKSRPTGSAAPIADLTGPLSPLTPPPGTPATSAPPTVASGAPPPPGPATGSLVGRVLLPARIISENGGGVIGNAGASVVSNNGSAMVGGAAARRLLAEEASALAGIAVTLVDAAGRPLAGPGGGPWRAVTDGTGTFAFQGALPAANVLAVVTFGADQAASAAVVRGRSGALTIDLASSLATSYILDRYVRPQGGDPQAIFDRLTPAAEEAARRATDAALAADAAGPDALTTEALVAALERLRGGAPDLDARLQDVKKLLVFVGVTDGGSGTAATEVPLFGIDDMAVAADGRIYFSCTDMGRIYELADGKLRTVFGNGSQLEDEVPDGAVATAVGMPDRGFWALRPTPDGAVWFAGLDVLYRIGADGKVRRAFTYPEGGFPIGLLPGADGEVWLAYEEQQADTATIVAFAPDLKARPVATWTASGGLGGLVGGAAAGAVWYLTGTTERQLNRHDLATGKTTSSDAGGYDDTAGIGPDGTRYATDGEALLAFPPGGGAARRLATLDPALGEMVGGGGATIAPAPDGSLYLAAYTAIYRIADGKLTRVAGTGGQGTAANGAIVVEHPSYLAATGDDTLYVTDSTAGYGSNRILRYEAGKLAATLVSDVAVSGALRIGGNGDLYMQSEGNEHFGDAIIRYAGGQGAGTAVFDVDEDGDGGGGGRDRSAFYDFLPEPDGSFLIAWEDGQTNDGKGVLRRWSKAGGWQDLARSPVMYPSLARDAAGKVYLTDGEAIYRLAGKALELIGDTGAGSSGHTYAAMRVDARGRCVVLADDGRRIFRVDPATGKSEQLAGPGGKFLAGDTPDDGIVEASDLALDATGDLFVADRGAHQIKKLPADLIK